jgi:hypothetical protein
MSPPSRFTAGRLPRRFGPNGVLGALVSKSKDSKGQAQPRDARPNVDVHVVEKDTDTSWAMFQALQNQQTRGFVKTKPTSLTAPPGQPVPLEDVSVDDVLVEARRNNRVCPLPTVWQKLYAFLPNTGPHVVKVPATRAEWTQLSALQKRARLREHIEWASSQGVLRQVYQALRRLPEDRWHHMGE